MWPTNAHVYYTLACVGQHSREAPPRRLCVQKAAIFFAERTFDTAVLCCVVVVLFVHTKSFYRTMPGTSLSASTFSNGTTSMAAAGSATGYVNKRRRLVPSSLLVLPGTGLSASRLRFQAVTMALPRFWIVGSHSPVADPAAAIVAASATQSIA